MIEYLNRWAWFPAYMVIHKAVYEDLQPAGLGWIALVAVSSVTIFALMIAHQATFEFIKGKKK
ncbi:MAG: hypothetical protein ACRDC4_12465 [Plesiomonas sp.]